MVYNNNLRPNMRQPYMQMPCQQPTAPCTSENADKIDKIMPDASCLMPSEYYPVAMAYVPWQTIERLYDADKAFVNGTAFPCLDKDFMAGGRCR